MISQSNVAASSRGMLKICATLTAFDAPRACPQSITRPLLPQQTHALFRDAHVSTGASMLATKPIKPRYLSHALLEMFVSKNHSSFSRAACSTN